MCRYGRVGLVPFTRAVCVSRGDLSGGTLMEATGSAVLGPSRPRRWKRTPVRSKLSGDVIAGVRLPPPLCPPHPSIDHEPVCLSFFEPALPDDYVTVAPNREQVSV